MQALLEERGQEVDKQGRRLEELERQVLQERAQQLAVVVEAGLDVLAFKLDDQQPHESILLARVEDRAEDGVVGALGPDPTHSLATLRGHTARERLGSQARR